ncbi:MAG: sugar phosphate isomerase/epimerase family protein [Anaerolineae bacterium]
MKVGLDNICFSTWKLDAMGLLQKTIDYSLEGLQLGSHLFLDKPAEYTDEFLAKLHEHNLYVELTGGGVNPRDSGKTVDQMIERWKPLFPLAAKMGAHCLNTCFGLYQERTMTSPTFAEQYEMAIQVLKGLAPMAADHKVFVTMELHVDLTYNELARMLDRVNSPWIRANLDTANSMGLMEDPVEAAEVLAPYAETTHYKDTCVYLTDEGYNWQGGAPLGTGLVDLPVVTRLLFKSNPDIHLNIEDGWGVIKIPCYDEAFLRSFPEQNAVRMMQFMKHLRRGKGMLDAGIHPHMEDIGKYDVRQAMAARLWHSANYARRLRDEIEAEAK